MNRGMTVAATEYNISSVQLPFGVQIFASNSLIDTLCVLSTGVYVIIRTNVQALSLWAVKQVANLLFCNNFQAQRSWSSYKNLNLVGS